MTSSDFDQVIQRVYEATGIDSQAELANVLRINRSAVTQARKKGAVPDKWLLQLYRQFGLNPEWLERGDGPTFLMGSTEEESEFEKIPKYKARLCAGDGTFEDEAEIQGFYSFRKDWLRKKGSYKQMVHNCVSTYTDIIDLFIMDIIHYRYFLNEIVYTFNCAFLEFFKSF